MKNIVVTPGAINRLYDATFINSNSAISRAYNVYSYTIPARGWYRILATTESGKEINITLNNAAFMYQSSSVVGIRMQTAIPLESGCTLAVSDQNYCVPFTVVEIQKG